MTLIIAAGGHVVTGNDTTPRLLVDLTLSHSVSVHKLLPATVPHPQAQPVATRRERDWSHSTISVLAEKTHFFLFLSVFNYTTTKSPPPEFNGDKHERTPSQQYWQTCWNVMSAFGWRPNVSGGSSTGSDLV